MVSEKIIVVLLIIAILFSVISVIITISSLNLNQVPTINIVQGKTTDSENGKISIIIEPPASGAGK
jgi:hypothetical protein